MGVKLANGMTDSILWFCLKYHNPLKSTQSWFSYDIIWKGGVDSIV